MLGQKFRVGREDNWDVLAEPGQRRALRTLGGPLFSKTPSDTQVGERLCVVSPGPQNRSEKCVKRKDSLTPHPRSRAPTRYAAYRSALERCGARAAPPRHGQRRAGSQSSLLRAAPARLPAVLTAFRPFFFPPFPSPDLALQCKPFLAYS